MKAGRFCIIFLLGIGLITVRCFNGSVSDTSVKTIPYPDEKAAIISRGFIALPVEAGKIMLMWRRFATDEPDVSFEIYKVSRCNQIKEFLGTTRKTFFIDPNLKKAFVDEYELVAIQNKQKLSVAKSEVAKNTEAMGSNKSAVFFDLGEEYKQARVATGDLNGDGNLEVVIQFSNDKSLDPYEVFKKLRKSRDTLKVAAFLMTGKLLWKLDLGWGIEAGAVYSPMVVWDIDADGKSEVILKTNPSGDPENYEGERVTILDGVSGRIIREERWPSTDGLLAKPKDTTRGTRSVYNSISRNYLAIAHLDGANSTIIAARGLYLAQKIVAFDYQLAKKWEKLIGLNNYNPAKEMWKNGNVLQRVFAKLIKDEYKGSHSLSIVDINRDGKEEILWGELCIGEGGKELWKIRERFPYNGHADIVVVDDIDPRVPGDEIFYCREGWGKKDDNIGMAVFNNRGKLLWGKWGYTHVDGGWVARVIPGTFGLQCCGHDLDEKLWEKNKLTYTNSVSYLWDYDGRPIKREQVDERWIRSFPLDWDGDGIREVCLADGSIVNWKSEIVDEFDGKPLWGGDIYGDHREELVVQEDGRKVFILFNVRAIEGEGKCASIEDRRYRNDLSRTAMQSNDIPRESGYRYRTEYKEDE